MARLTGPFARFTALTRPRPPASATFDTPTTHVDFGEELRNHEPPVPMPPIVLSSALPHPDSAPSLEPALLNDTHQNVRVGSHDADGRFLMSDSTFLDLAVPQTRTSIRKASSLWPGWPTRGWFKFVATQPITNHPLI